jgi:hypothetical protein
VGRRPSRSALNEWRLLTTSISTAVILQSTTGHSGHARVWIKSDGQAAGFIHQSLFLWADSSDRKDASVGIGPLESLPIMTSSASPIRFIAKPTYSGFRSKFLGILRG